MAKIGVLTLSDRASQGIYEDVSGEAIKSVLQEYISSPIEFVYRLCGDELTQITTVLCELSDDIECDLIVTTGGTGPASRDVTPEAMEKVCDKMLPGFGELMRNVSLKYVPTAILSRQSAGIRKKSLIVNLPGKPQSIRECLEAVFPAIPYCIDLIGGDYITTHENIIKAFRPKSASSHTLMKMPNKDVVVVHEAKKTPQNSILSHLDKNNHPRMVDVSEKNETDRIARACGKITVNQEAFLNVIEEKNKKGPVLQTAIIAAIMGAKKTSDLIPMCHPLNVNSIDCEIKELHDESAFLLIVTVKLKGVTGVEMEALMGVSIGLLTIYDMLKAIDQSMVISDVMLLEKSGGKSGSFSRTIPCNKR